MCLMFLCVHVYNIICVVCQKCVCGDMQSALFMRTQYVVWVGLHPHCLLYCCPNGCVYEQCFKSNVEVGNPVSLLACAQVIYSICNNCQRRNGGKKSTLISTATGGSSSQKMVPYLAKYNNFDYVLA